MAEKVERRLAAILNADVVGYSRLIGADEEGTLARLRAHREPLIDPKYLGRTDEVSSVLDDLLRRFPAFWPRYILDFSPMIDGKGFRHTIEGLRKAGLTE